MHRFQKGSGIDKLRAWSSKSSKILYSNEISRKVNSSYLLDKITGDADLKRVLELINWDQLSLTKIWYSNEVSGKGNRSHLLEEITGDIWVLDVHKLWQSLQTLYCLKVEKEETLIYFGIFRLEFWRSSSICGNKSWFGRWKCFRYK